MTITKQDIQIDAVCPENYWKNRCNCPAVGGRAGSPIPSLQPKPILQYAWWLEPLDRLAAE